MVADKFDYNFQQNISHHPFFLLVGWFKSKLLNTPAQSFNNKGIEMSNERATPIEQHRIKPNSQGQAQTQRRRKKIFTGPRSMVEQGIFSNQANSFQKIMKSIPKTTPRSQISHNMRQITLLIFTVHFARANALINVDDNSQNNQNCTSQAQLDEWILKSVLYNPMREVFCKQ